MTCSERGCSKPRLLIVSKSYNSPSFFKNTLCFSEKSRILFGESNASPPKKKPRMTVLLDSWSVNKISSNLSHWYSWSTLDCTYWFTVWISSIISLKSFSYYCLIPYLAATNSTFTRLFFLSEWMISNKSTGLTNLVAINTYWYLLASDTRSIFFFSTGIALISSHTLGRNLMAQHASMAYSTFGPS